MFSVWLFITEMERFLGKGVDLKERGELERMKSYVLRYKSIIKSLLTLTSLNCLLFIAFTICFPFESLRYKKKQKGGEPKLKKKS